MIMSMVRIDYLGTCEELGFSTDSYAWWRPFYRWTFSDGEKEYSIVCRHAQSYFEKILNIALSKDAPIEDAQEAAKHQINQHISFEDDIDHIGIDFFDNDGQLRVVGPMSPVRKLSLSFIAIRRSLSMISPSR